MNERGLLTLVQWLSPAFPVGAFAYSHGLEMAIQSRTVSTSDDLRLWLTDVLQHGTGRNDAILLRAAYNCDDDGAMSHVDAMAKATCASRERVLETQLQGGAFCQTTSTIWGNDLTDLTYPVAVGAAAKRLDIDLNTTVALYLQAFVSNLTSAAVRAVPLGQTEGQFVLAELNPLCDLISDQTQNTGLDDLQSTAFLSDISSMRHEMLQPRIFRS